MRIARHWMRRESDGAARPMHGIPVLVKDNIDTHDRMMTTAGSLALMGSIAPRDSFIREQIAPGRRGFAWQDDLRRVANFRG